MPRAVLPQSCPPRATCKQRLQVQSCPPRGLEIRKSALVTEGTLVWLRGSEVIGVSSKSRRDFLGLFGLQTAAPPGTTGVMLSPADYDHLFAELDRA